MPVAGPIKSGLVLVGALIACMAMLKQFEVPLAFDGSDLLEHWYVVAIILFLVAWQSTNDLRVAAGLTALLYWFAIRPAFEKDAREAGPKKKRDADEDELTLDD